MVGQAEKSVSPMERERILTQAAEDYLRGRISYEEMTAIRRQHSWRARGQRRRAEARLREVEGRRWWEWWRR